MFSKWNTYGARGILENGLSAGVDIQGPAMNHPEMAVATVYHVLVGKRSNHVFDDPVMNVLETNC
jgi:hypothetical protein